MENNYPNFVKFQLVNVKDIDLNNLFLNLPDKFKIDTYINPYSNKSLNIPEGLGFLDQMEVTQIQQSYEQTPQQSAPRTAIDRAVYVAKKLIEKGGFSKELAAAIAGTFLDESNCNPAAYMKQEKSGKGASSTRGSNRYGAGIGQWTGDSKVRVLKQAGYSPSTKIETLTLDQQIDLLIKDTQTGMKKYYDALKRCNTIEDASATSVVITGGVGKSSNWTTHPTVTDAKRIADWYGRSNDKRFGKSAHHWNLDKRRLDYSKQVLARL